MTTPNLYVEYDSGESCKNMESNDPNIKPKPTAKVILPSNGLVQERIVI